MAPSFLLYGSTGFLGEAIAPLAIERGLQPLLAGRNRAKVGAQAAGLGLEHRVASLDDPAALDAALQQVPVVLHCAGPYVYTYRPMVEACLRTGTHYLDITGELQVYQALAAYDEEARQRGIMILPGVGFDVVPTDCLAAHLKRRLPSATHLALAFNTRGPGGLPPGTANSLVNMIPFGLKARRDGQLRNVRWPGKLRSIDFGRGPERAMLLTWGDVVTAYYSTGIPNIEDYAALPPVMMAQLTIINSMRPIFRSAAMRRALRAFMPVGSTPEQRARSSTSVWGQARDGQGSQATARMHGPEASVNWTSLAALAVVEQVLAGHAPLGFQTPSTAYGPDFALSCEGVSREDVD